MAKHILTFDQHGNMSADAQGYTGKVCEETTKKLVAGLGGQITDDRKKPEYNARTIARVANR